MNIIETQNFIEKNGYLPETEHHKLISRAIKKADEYEVGPSPPAGLYTDFEWQRKESEITLKVWLNSANSLGVVIHPLQKGDMVEVQSASGNASFSQSEGNSLALSIVGIVAGVADAIIPGPIGDVISAGNKFAQEFFEEEKVKTKRRDPYGEDPGTGHKARQEGGVLISLPGSGGPVFSGNNDHKERWIQGDGERIATNYPKHLRKGFFLYRGDIYKRHSIDESGQLYITPWDHKFEDNAGYYEIYLRIVRGS